MENIRLSAQEIGSEANIGFRRVLMTSYLGIHLQKTAYLRFWTHPVIMLRAVTFRG